MGSSRQEYWSGLPFPSPEDLPHPGIESGSPALAGRFFTTESPGNGRMAAVHGVTQSRTRLMRLSMHACIGEGNGNHSSIPAWRLPGTEEPGGLQSMGSHRVGHDWCDLACMHALEKEMATTGDWRLPGTAEPGGLPSMGSHRVGRDWCDLAAAANEHRPNENFTEQPKNPLFEKWSELVKLDQSPR